MEAKVAIEIVHQIRTFSPKGFIGDYHPFASLSSNGHPFDRNSI
jgi:hypothetical protein